MDLLVLNTFTCVADSRSCSGRSDYLTPRTPWIRWWRSIAEARSLCGWIKWDSWISVQTPGGAFYAWVNIERDRSGCGRRCKILLEEAGVAGIAGAALVQAERIIYDSARQREATAGRTLERIQRVSARWARPWRGRTGIPDCQTLRQATKVKG